MSSNYNIDSAPKPQNVGPTSKLRLNKQNLLFRFVEKNYSPETKSITTSNNWELKVLPSKYTGMA